MNVDDEISTHARTFGGAIQKLGQRVLIHLDDVCNRELELVCGPSNKQFLQTRMTNKNPHNPPVCFYPETVSACLSFGSLGEYPGPPSPLGHALSSLCTIYGTSSDLHAVLQFILCKGEVSGLSC